MKRALILLIALAVFIAASQPRAQPAAAPRTALDLVGTWTLDEAEQSINAQPSRIQNPRGLLVFDGAGHVFEAVTRATQRLGSDTPAADAGGLSTAQRTFATFEGFWGTYKIDAAGKTITYQPEGGVSPSIMGRELTRTVTFANDKLTITSAADEPHTQGGARWTWERVPVVDSLSPNYRQVIGFWQHVVEKRINLTTSVTTETHRAPSIIVYTPSGYVGVHFPPLNRQKFAAAEPTDAEARAALMGFVDYFGALSVYPGMVFHQVLAGISPVAGTTLKRPFELKGQELTIKFPVATNQQGQQTTTEVVLRRLSGDKDMMPRRVR